MRLMAVLLVVMSLMACRGPGSSGKNAIVATVGDEKITAAQLDEKAEGRLKRLEGEIFRIKRDVLEQMIEDKLLEQAAKKKNLSVGEFVQKETGDKVKEPSEADMKSLYDSHKGKDTKPFEELKSQIRAYMMRSQEMQARNELMSRLRKEMGVKIYLEPPRVEVVGIEEAPSIGPKDAKVTLVEFSDYQCPFCKRVRPTVNRLLEVYGDRMRYVFVDNPLGFHKNAPKAHEAAHCAGEQNKYFEYCKKLFDNQDAIEVADLKKYAKELQLDTAKFDQCLDSGKYASRVQKGLQAGAVAGVSGTPTFFINGILLSGAQPYEAFVDLIEAELNK